MTTAPLATATGAEITARRILTKTTGHKRGMMTMTITAMAQMSAEQCDAGRVHNAWHVHGGSRSDIPVRGGGTKYSDVNERLVRHVDIALE